MDFSTHFLIKKILEILLRIFSKNIKINVEVSAVLSCISKSSQVIKQFNQILNQNLKIFQKNFVN